MSSKAYIVCQYAKCPAYPNTNLRSWRPLNKGPDCCKFCNTPFRVHTASSGNGGKKGGGKGGSKGYSGGTGGSGGSGGDYSAAADGGDWMVRDSKGRTKPAKEKTDFDDGKMETFFREKLASLPQFSDFAEDLLQNCFPKKQKTQQELLKDGVTAVDRAQASHDHFAKVCADMQTAYDKRFQELLDYKQNLQSHLGKLETAKAALSAARQDLIELKANDSGGDAGFGGTQEPSLPLKQVQEGVTAFNPTAGIVRSLANVPAIADIPHDKASQIGEAMSLCFKQQLQDFCSQFFASIPPPPPPPPPQNVTSECGKVEVSNSEDVAMLGRNKRGIQEITAADDAVAAMAGMDEEDGVGSFDASGISVEEHVSAARCKNAAALAAELESQLKTRAVAE